MTPESYDNINEKDLISGVLEKIDNGDFESALVFIKRFRGKNLSPLAYARMLVLLDQALASKLNKIVEAADRDKKGKGRFQAGLDPA